MEGEILDTLNDSVLPEDVQEKLSILLQKYQELSDEDKEQFQNGAFDILKKTLHTLQRNTILPAWLAPYQSYILFILAVSIVVFLLVIISRKLYKRTSEREQYREEKKKLKQQKAEMKKNKKKKT